jgi:hypothetical protein
LKVSLISRLKNLETRLDPLKINGTNQYKYTFENWTMDDIKVVLFGNNITPEIEEKWNLTDWGDRPVYLQYLTVQELKRLEQIILEGEMQSA